MRLRVRRVTVILLTALLIIGLLPLYSHAKDMEECYHCNKTGKFNCPECGNTGEVVCDGCHGQGKFECPGEEGKGKCDNGWYVCPSCNGDGLSRPIPADGNADPCGQCGGSGKLECWHCHGAGILICDRCNGNGKYECPNGNCKEARKIDYKCPYCKGTGFLGDGQDFPPEWNDGIHNVPEKGDHIITDHASWTGYYYGTDETDKDKQGGGSSGGGEGEDDLSERRDPVTGRDYVWFIDVGDGVWDIEDQHIVVTRDGSPVSGILDVKYNDMFKLEGITNWSTHIYLVADGFKTELSGRGEYSVANRTPKSPKVPFNVKMEIEYIEGSAPVESGFQAKHFVDFGTGSRDVGGKTVTILLEGEPVSGVVEIEEGAVITFDNLDRETMTVYLCGKNDFRVTLIPSGDDKFALGIYEPKDAVLSGGVLSIDIEYKAQETEETEEDQGFEGIPDDRNSDFDIIPRPADGGEQRSSAVVEISRMTDEEQRYYAGLSDQELTGIVDNVKEIVQSVQPGKCEDGEMEFYTKLAHDNGFDSVEDGRIYPIYFEGHTDVGFPVRVSVTIEKGELNGGSDIYVYHQLIDGSIESLGRAEYDTYDDGSIHSLSFYTTGFSSFFTAAKELDVSAVDVPDAQSDPGSGEDVSDQNTTDSQGSEGGQKSGNNTTAVVIIIAAVCVAAAIAAVIILLIRKKRA